MKGGRGVPLSCSIYAKMGTFRKFSFLPFMLSTLCRQLESSPARGAFVLSGAPPFISSAKNLTHGDAGSIVDPYKNGGGSAPFPRASSLADDGGMSQKTVAVAHRNTPK